MPLIHSSSKPAFKANVSTLMHDVGKSPHVQSQKQALAIAYETARRAKKAGGGGVPMSGGPGRFQALERVGKGYQPPPPPKPVEKAGGGGVTHGFLNSPVPGRTDQLPITVGGGAYVLPADHVAALGQGNSLAGADIVNKMFKMGPYGMALANAKGIRSPKTRKKFAEGGGIGKPTPIVAAGGEIVLPPEKIMDRFGDLDRGHKALDSWVVKTRQQHIKTLGGLRPPKKD